jgi:hypothetical protein
MPKHGDVREDGMVFWGMAGKHQDWRSPDKFYAAKKRNHDNKIRIKKIRRYTRHPRGAVCVVTKNIRLLYSSTT